MNQFKNYYTLLKVEPDAEREEIVTAFWKMAREWHPERNDQAIARGRFVRIFAGFRILNDPARRRIHDELQMATNDFQRSKSQHWASYASWVEAATAEGDKLAGLAFERLERRVLITNTFLFTRIILLGEEAFTAQEWALLIGKMAVIALVVVGISTISSTGAAAFIERSLDALAGQFVSVRAIIGIGIGVVTFVIFGAFLILLATLSMRTGSVVGKFVGGVICLFFGLDGRLFPMLPALVAFGLFYGLWSMATRLM